MQICKKSQEIIITVYTYVYYNILPKIITNSNLKKISATYIAISVGLASRVSTPRAVGDRTIDSHVT